MNENLTMAIAAALMMSGSVAQAQGVNIGHNNITLTSDLMTPKTLWAMGRIGTAQASPDGRKVVYQMSYYNVKENKGHQVLRVMDADDRNNHLLIASVKSEGGAAWLGNNTSAFLIGGQLWTMNVDGTNRKQLTHSDIGIEGFRFSPDCKRVVLIESIPYYGTIKQNPSDLPEATGMVITDMNYRHWDHYTRTDAHPFVTDATIGGVGMGVNVLEGEPYESPLAPFGGTERIDWSKDSKFITYTCCRKEGTQYTISTDTGTYVYNVETRQTKNLCKPADYVEPKIDVTKSMRNQAVNHQAGGTDVDYDVSPKFSPDSKYIAWQSVKNNGYGSDRNRLCVYGLAAGKKTYVTESFDSNVNNCTWSLNSEDLYFIGIWHAMVNVYQTNLKGGVKQLTEDNHNYVSISFLGDKKLLVIRQNISQANEILAITPAKKEKASAQTQFSFEDKYIYDQLALGDVKSRQIKTTNDKEVTEWVITPPHFDPNRRYPALLFCEDEPQSPVSQFWDYRWNFQMMAANGYVIIAPNHHGLSGFGSAWNEEISTDWTGRCMDDYLSVIDDTTDSLPLVDENRLGAVDASFNGFSVYYLAGIHKKRLKCLISHDDAFNLESIYTDIEEAWFGNWEYDDTYWNKDKSGAVKRTYANNPRLNVGKWGTPILCIHNEKDYHISANQGMGTFNAARLRGIPAELLLYPDENHWVLKP